jgi:hypothetical protein
LEAVAESEPKYADFDGLPSRYGDGEAWVFTHSAGWYQINAFSHGMNSQPLTKAQFDECFPGTPPLPSTVFRRGETATMRAELAKEHVDFDKVAKEQELKLPGERAPLADPGGDRNSEAARLDQCDNVTLIERANSAAYLAARKRDNPDIAGPLAAGIVREPGLVHSKFVKRRDQALLAELTPRERRLVESLMDNYPALPLAKAIAMLKAAGA